MQLPWAHDAPVDAPALLVPAGDGRRVEGDDSGSLRVAVALGRHSLREGLRRRRAAGSGIEIVGTAGDDETMFDAHHRSLYRELVAHDTGELSLRALRPGLRDP